jgi:type II secretory pathway pseudopilin PulG
MKSRRNHDSRQSSEQGYILLVLLLFIALLTIAATAIAPSIVFQVKRDREEELIHRGVQYSRAVRHYFKKFNRYPSKIEDLESTNNYRCLRKRYKDPITGGDFKLLHLGEVQMALAPAGVGGLTPSVNAGSGPGNQLGQSGSGFGGGNFGATQPGPGAGTASPGGTNVSDSAATSSGAVNSSDQSDSGSTNATTVRPGGANSIETGNDTDKVQTFGGGPIVGVVSTSKAQSIREFNKKDHYNKWLFIYDPQSDRGGLLNTPAQPALQGAVSLGQPGAPGVPSSGFGSQAPGAPGSPFGGGMQQPPPQNTPPAQEQP